MPYIYGRKQINVYDYGFKTLPIGHTDIRANTKRRQTLHRQDGIRIPYGTYQRSVFLPGASAPLREVAARIHLPELFRGKEGLVQGTCHRETGKGMDRISCPALRYEWWQAHESTAAGGVSGLPAERRRNEMGHQQSGKRHQQPFDRPH